MGLNGLKSLKLNGYKKQGSRQVKKAFLSLNFITTLLCCPVSLINKGSQGSDFFSA